VRRLEQGSIYKEIWKMKAISVLKAQAKNLQAALSAQGRPVKLGQAQELIAQQYGHPNWDTVAGILNAPEPEPRAPRLSDMPGMPDSVRVERGVRGAMFVVVHRLPVPAVVKSLKGTSFIKMFSQDWGYDKYVAVPADKDAAEVARLLDAELERLKALDRANQEDPKYAEYSEDDVDKFVASLGCVTVKHEHRLSLTWD
jgi:hypothetical protein